MNTVIEKIIEEYASLRKVTMDQVKDELRNGNENTKNELFKLACAFESCKKTT